MKTKHTLISTLILALILALVPATAVFAHKVIIFAWVEDGMIHTESSFGSDRKAKECAITVVDEQGRVVHSGVTDDQGNYSFKIPEPAGSDLIIKLQAGTGHQGQWTISRDELMTVHTQKDVETAMKEKEALEKDPSVFKIMGGIGVIFLLALSIKFLKRKKTQNDR